ncbi:hypothetical protein K2Y11_18360 [bacterium]|nr:hypothetical protein [bacterium]
MSKLWVDASFDGCDDIEARRSKPKEKNAWFDFMGTIPGFEKLAQRSFLAKPVQSEVNVIVKELLNRCVEMKPAWITIPQMPITEGSDRNKLNRALATATGKWKSSSGYSGRLILPLIFMHQKQLNKKTDRNPKVQQAEKCYLDAQADGLWVVDQSLIDDSGSATLRSNRFPGLISLHEELNDRIPSKFRMGGPYWGLNLVLWAKGLIEFPLIGVGSGYNYFLSGGISRPASARIAIPALRRRVKVSSYLETWFDKAISKLATSHPAHSEFLNLRKNLTVLADSSRSREQVATFYKQWFDGIASVPAAGRSMAMFQDLSAAYALGKALPPFDDEGTARRPESVAEPLMLSCL